MEASGLGNGQPAAASPAGEPGGPGEQQQQQQQPSQGLEQQLAQLTSGQEEMRQFLMSMVQPGASESEGQPETPETAPLNLDLFDPANPQFDPEAMAAHLSDVINAQADARAQALIAPVSEQVDEMRRGREADMLASEFPELSKPEVAAQVVQTAQQLAIAHGHPELAAEPWFWRTTMMATRAAELAREEGEQGDPAHQAATLEGGSGARPGGAPQGQQLTADSIVNARKGRSVLPF